MKVTAWTDVSEDPSVPLIPLWHIYCEPPLDLSYKHQEWMRIQT